MIHQLAPTLAVFPPVGKYLVAVSGGCDSMVLLDLLQRLHYENLILCHLNHELRGSASEADAALVQSAAAHYGYPLLLESCPVQTLATTRKLSLETAARQARQEFFLRCAKQTGYTQIFLAHHADDQAETVLMNVLRGSGLRGVGGMRVRAPLNSQLEIIRPLLAFPRAELRAWAQAHAVKFSDDASNESPAFLRNRLRHELLPTAARTMQRDVGAALVRLATMAQAEDDYLTEITQTLFPPRATLATASILAAPLALQRRALHAWLQHHAIPKITFELVEQLRQILPPDAPKAKCNLPGGRWVRRKSGVLFIQ